MRFSPMFLAAKVSVSVTYRLGFRYMHPAMGTGHHFGHRWFIWRWISARCQGAFDDSQDQPQADQDDDEAKELTHNYREGLIKYDYLTQRREGAKRNLENK